MGRRRRSLPLAGTPLHPDEQAARRLIGEAASLTAAAAGLRAASDFDLAEIKAEEARGKRAEAAYLRNRMKVQSTCPTRK